MVHTNSTTIIGVIICLAGVLLTVFGYASASGGGTYTVWWGAIVVGFFVFIKGIMQGDKPSDEAFKPIRVTSQVSAFMDQGVALSKQRKYEEAIKAYDEAIKLDPTDPNIWNKKGAALEALGKTSEANVAFDKADELIENSR